MDFKNIFLGKISIVFVLLHVINGIIGTPVPDTKTKTAAATEKPKMGCYKKFCTLFGDICAKGGTCVSGEGCAGHCHCTKEYKGRYCQIKVDSDEDNNGHTNGKSSDNGNGNGHDNGNGKSNARTEKKPTVGVIMKLFKGLRTNGNGDTSNSNTANGGKVSSSKHPPVKAAAQTEQEVKSISSKSGSESLKRVNTDGNVKGNLTTKMNHNGNATTLGETTDQSADVKSSMGKSITTTSPTIEADHQNITGNTTNGENEIDNNTTTSTTVDTSTVETTTNGPENNQSTEMLSPTSTNPVGKKVKAAETRIQTKPDKDSLKPVVENKHLQLTTTEQPSQPISKSKTKPTETEAMTVLSKANPQSSGSVKTVTEINAGNVNQNTTSSKDTTVNNTAGPLPKSEFDAGTAKTLITKITIGNSKTKSKSAVEIPKLKNSEVSSSAIADSAVPLTLSKSEFSIRDVPVTARNSDTNHQLRTDNQRSAAQLWPVHKSSTRNEESALPRVSSGTVKSTLEDANRWVASGFEPDMHSDKFVMENMALVLGKDIQEEEDVQESKPTSGNIPLVRNGNDVITSKLERTARTKSTAGIFKANNEHRNNTVFLPKGIPPKTPLSMSIEKRLIRQTNHQIFAHLYQVSIHSFIQYNRLNHLKML